ncbi:hypothetical protein E2C01_030869 [Portunus trituberculatus]|uniref:Uncharacterized protein n=1 Tax=Portunus trituberculatus TaxID=210409 RepID=A0A5B7EX02_PORTR|nr:hypothetical protein [Portunus trituberculatus]
MEYSSHRPDSTLDRSWGKKVRKVEEARYVVQEERQKELDETEKHIQTRIMYEEGTHLLTSMEDKIREWVFQKKSWLLITDGLFNTLTSAEASSASPDTSRASRHASSREISRPRVICSGLVGGGQFVLHLGCRGVRGVCHLPTSSPESEQIPRTERPTVREAPMRRRDHQGSRCGCKGIGGGRRLTDNSWEAKTSRSTGNVLPALCPIPEQRDGMDQDSGSIIVGYEYPGEYGPWSLGQPRGQGLGY